jgi:RND family efflux transporter MFP subunit
VSMKRFFRVVLIVAVVGGLGAFAGLRIREAYQKKSTPTTKAGKKGGGMRIISVGLGEAKSGLVNEELLITGALKPREQVDVNSKATGRLTQIYFHVGDAVKRGALIAELEDDEIQQQVNRATASLEVAKASLAQRQAELSNMKAELGRSKQLLEDGLIPRTDFETRETSYRVVQAQVQLARAQVDQAEAELNELRIRLEQTKIYSPMDGYVGRRYVDPGALLTPATPILHIVNLATMVSAANVPERDVAKLRIGNRAVVHVDAFGERRFEGRVVRISPLLDPATRSAMVEIEIPNPDGGLKAEMFARLVLDLATKRQSVLIPREALVYRGQQPGVYVLDENERPAFRTIETGLTQGNDVEVLANLSVGTKIITQGASMLTEGDQIRVAGAPGGEREGRRGERSGFDQKAERQGGPRGPGSANTP